MGTARTAIAATVFAFSALLLAWVAWQWFSPPEAAKPLQASPTPAVSTRPTPAASPKPTPTAASSAPQALPPITASPSPEPTTPPPPPAAPTDVRTFEIPSAAYSSEVGTMEIANSGVINPPDFEHTWWIKDRGVIPSSQATDTTYLACHTHSRKSAAVVPCNKVTLENVPIGSQVTVVTDTETLTYTVIQARKVPRTQFEHDADIWDINPGRLVWISCYLEGGRYSEFNIVVIAELAPSA
ncbi:MAG: hypothetical protein Q4G35_05470 [Propionibacteriaceae bacterium]|nr:hypothetical protein [Propionibacteriaceae bacterium]